jgi:chromate transporter
MSGEIRTSRQVVSCRDLALTFLKLGSIGFGGGMAMIALMEHEFVGKRRVMESEEFLHGVGLGQLLGPFAVNTAFFIGYREQGALGGLLSASSFMLPSFALTIFFSWLYFAYHALPALQGVVAGLGPVVIALIVSAAWTMGRKALRSWPAVVLAMLAAAASLYRVSTVTVLVVAGVAGLVLGKRRLRGGERGKGAQPPPPQEKQTSRSGAAAWVLSAQGLSTAGTVSLSQLGLVFLKVGLVFFGGGFVLIPVLHQALVVNLHWLNAQEFIDGIAISNLTPGPISVLATFAGYRVLGITGALIATAALFLPAAILMFVLCHQYERMKSSAKVQDFLAGVVPAVIGLILAAAVLLSREALHSWQGYALSLVCLLLLVRLRWHPAIVLAIGALAGAASLLG